VKRLEDEFLCLMGKSRRRWRLCLRFTNHFSSLYYLELILKTMTGRSYLGVNSGSHQT